MPAAPRMTPLLGNLNTADLMVGPGAPREGQVHTAVVMGTDVDQPRKLAKRSNSQFRKIRLFEYSAPASPGKLRAPSFYCCKQGLRCRPSPVPPLVCNSCPISGPLGPKSDMPCSANPKAGSFRSRCWRSSSLMMGSRCVVGSTGYVTAGRNISFGKRRRRRRSARLPPTDIWLGFAPGLIGFGQLAH